MFRVQVLSHHCISLTRISNCMIALLFALRKRMSYAVRRALPTVAWSHKVTAFCALNYLNAVSWRHVAVNSLYLDFAHLLRSNLIRCCGLDKCCSSLSTCFKGLEVDFHCSRGLLDQIVFLNKFAFATYSCLFPGRCKRDAAVSSWWFFCSQRLLHLRDKNMWRRYTMRNSGNFCFWFSTLTNSCWLTLSHWSLSYSFFWWFFILFSKHWAILLVLIINQTLLRLSFSIWICNFSIRERQWILNLLELTCTHEIKVLIAFVKSVEGLQLLLFCESCVIDILYFNYCFDS